MDRPIEFIEILKYLTEEDETSLILKSHLHVEREIEFLIKKAFIRPEYLKKLSFAEKIKVLCSLNIIDISMYNDIARFNAIRNAFSHKYKYKLANDDLSFLRKVIGEEVSDITKDTKEIIVYATAVFTGYLQVAEYSFECIDARKFVNLDKVDAYKERVKNVMEKSE